MLNMLETHSLDLIVREFTLRVIIRVRGSLPGCGKLAIILMICL
jgi:hypothetical protein